MSEIFAGILNFGVFIVIWMVGAVFNLWLVDNKTKFIEEYPNFLMIFGAGLFLVATSLADFLFPFNFSLL